MADSYYRANYSGDTNNRIYLEQHIYTVATDLANLRTTERTDLYMVVNDASSQWWNLYGSEAYVGINGNDKTDTVTFDARSTGVKALISSWDTVIQHASDGSANGVGISAHHYSGVGLGNASISGSYNCDTLVVTPTFTTNPSITNKTETTITIDRGSTDISCNFYYSINQGVATRITSQSTTITGLNPSTMYRIVVFARNSNNEDYMISKSLRTNTYAMPTQTITAKTETTISVSWSISTTASHIWYSIDGGNNWRDLGGISATSGSYTITNLTANTTYNVRTQLVREENNTNVATASNSITTYNIPSISLVNKTVNSITVRWNIDETANHAWASTDNGNNWTDLGDISATTGEYTASNLEPNSFYYLKIRLRRASTNSLSVTSTLTESTYDIARITGATDIIIGQNATIHYSNPSGATIYSYIEYVMADGNGSVVVSERQITGNQYTYEFTSNEIQAIYARIPNELSHTYRYVIRTFANNQSYYHIVDRTFYVDRENSKPTFSNFTYEDTDSRISALTGNNQIIVNGFSDITVTISSANKATANNSASISKYRVTIGSVSQEATYSSSADVTSSFTNQTSQVISVTAIDSRGLETTVSKTVTFKDYQRIIVKKATIQREDGIGTKVFFDLKGTYWNGNFGATSNSMENTYYRWKEIGGNFSNFIKVTNSITSSDGTFESVSNAFLPTTDNGTVPQEFELGKRYEIQLIPQDKLYDAYWQPQILILDSGIPAVDKIYNDDGTYSVGINQLPDENYALAVTGDVKSDSTFNIDGSGISKGFAQNEHMLIREDNSESGATVVSGTGAGNNTSGAIIFRPYHTATSTAEARLDNINDESVYRVDKVITNDLTVFGEKITDGIIVSSTEPNDNTKIWVQQGKNLIKGFYAGKFYNWTNNTWEDSMMFATSYFIPVTYGQTYIFSHALNQVGGAVLCFDENMNYLSLINQDTILTPFTITSSSIKFIRVIAYDGNHDIVQNETWMQLEIGSVSSSYEDYIPKKIMYKNGGKYNEFYNEDNFSLRRLNNYSTVETRIGTWIDNKPLYKRTFDISNITSSNTNLVNLYSYNIDNIIKISGFVKASDGYILPMPLTDSSSNYAVILYNGTYLRGRCAFGSGGTVTSAYVTIEYTKTSD